MGDSLFDILKDMVLSVNWKLGLLMIIFAILIFSDLFVLILNNNYEGILDDLGIPTQKTKFIQIGLQVVSYLALDVAIRANLL